MEEDFLKRYQAAWRQDADDLLDEVAPPMEEILAAVARRERQRRHRRTALLSGLAAMVVLAVLLIFAVRPAAEGSAPIVAANTPGTHPVAAPAVAKDSSADLRTEPQSTTQQNNLAQAVPQRQEPLSATSVLPVAQSEQRPDGAVRPSNFEVAYLDNYRIDSLHTAPATLITAKDSDAWEWLSTQFALGAATEQGVSFVQRSYQLSDKDREPAGIDIDTGSYLLATLPSDRAIVVIHYESVGDLIDLLHTVPSNYAENDTQILESPRLPRKKVPEDHEKVPNRHNVRIKSPTYYQAITPHSQNVRQYPK